MNTTEKLKNYISDFIETKDFNIIGVKIRNLNPIGKMINVKLKLNDGSFVSVDIRDYRYLEITGKCI